MVRKRNEMINAKDKKNLKHIRKIPLWTLELPDEVNNIEPDDYVTADIRSQQKYRRSKMSWILKVLLNFIPFGKTILFKGGMTTIIWILRNIIDTQMTPDLLQYISATKDVKGNYVMGVETSKLKTAANITPRKWDDKIADLTLVVNEELCKIKQRQNK